MTQRIDTGVTRPEPIRIQVNGRPLSAYPGESVAVALRAAGIVKLRVSPREGTPRGAFCHMGVCQECMVRIDGLGVRACTEVVRDGMEIVLERDVGSAD